MLSSPQDFRNVRLCRYTTNPEKCYIFEILYISIILFAIPKYLDIIHLFII
jgi:hypothetical protein